MLHAEASGVLKTVCQSEARFGCKYEILVVLGRSPDTLLLGQFLTEPIDIEAVYSLSPHGLTGSYVATVTENQ